MGFLALFLSVMGCVPMGGDWQGICAANGSWDIQISNMRNYGETLEGAAQPGEWVGSQGSATLSPAMGSASEFVARMWWCDPFHAPCTHQEADGSLTESDANAVQGELLERTGGATFIRWYAVFQDDDDEIEGSCYNLVEGGAGSFRLAR